MDKLPEEILEIIFKQLNCEDLKNAAEVCKSWEQAFLNSHKLKSKMKFSWKQSQNADIISNVKKMRRNLRDIKINIMLTNFQHDYEAMMTALYWKGKSLTKLSLFCKGLERHLDLESILNLTPNVIEVKIEVTNFARPIHFSDEDRFKFFNAIFSSKPKIKSVKIIGINAPDSNKFYNDKNFTIETLKLGTESVEKIIKMMQKFSNLKKLSISKINIIELATNPHFPKLFINLEELCFGTINEKALKVALLPNLKTIRFHVCWDVRVIFDFLQANKSINQVEIYWFLSLHQNQDIKLLTQLEHVKSFKFSVGCINEAFNIYNIMKRERNDLHCLEFEIGYYIKKQNIKLGKSRIYSQNGFGKLRPTSFNVKALIYQKSIEDKKD